VIERLPRVGMVARWKPVHLGHAAVLRALTSLAELALIGIGSSNRYDARNPFTVEETEAMIRVVLGGRDNYRLVRVPDLGDGPRWRVMVLELFGPLDWFVTDNPYVASLMKDDYRVVRPIEIVSEEERVPIDGMRVRQEMARGDRWRELVPTEVAELIVQLELDQRFRREFGLATLALESPSRGG
jgi:nicotinamide-nucleotide adenylyltransferase